MTLCNNLSHKRGVVVFSRVGILSRVGIFSRDYSTKQQAYHLSNDRFICKAQ